MAEINFAETRIPVVLDRERVMMFNGNTLAAYEQVTGKFFLDTVTRLQQTIFPNGHKDENGNLVEVRISKLDILRKVSMVDLKALLWATIHEYDSNDEPHWPLTQSQIGKYITLDRIIPIFILFLTGMTGNAPSKEELGESTAETEKKESVESQPPNEVDAGGEGGIVLPADALA